MYYRTSVCFNAKQSAREGLEKIKSKLMSSYDNKHVVIGYKGGDFEQRLYRYFDCLGVNIEFLDCPIFGSEEGREKKESFCRFHARRRFTNRSYHCARQEVILFSCFILKNRHNEYNSLLSKYGCC